MSHIIASDKQRLQLKHGGRVEKQTQEVLDVLKREQSHIVYLDNKEQDPTNELKAMGKSLTHVDFERLLLPLLPSGFTAIDNPYVNDKRAIVKIKHSHDTFIGSFETIVAYEKGWMPEHSVLQSVTKEIGDPDIIGRKTKLSRERLGKYEYVPGQGYVFDDTVARPGFKYVKQAGRELKRGWRTVLLKLLLGKYLSLSQIEKTFGRPDDLLWAQGTGTHEHVTPW